MATERKFHRYEGCDRADDKVRMTRDTLDAKVLRLSIGELVGQFERFLNNEGSGPAMYPWATRFVLGFPLPSWQRPLCWTAEQKTRFIESIWAGVDIGSYLVNEAWEYQEDSRGASVYREFSEVLLDGQQRLTAIEDYLLGKIAVPDDSGTPRLWTDLPQVERRRFCQMTFAKACIQSWDEQLLRKVYDLRAFGGTAHTEDQRAS
ncbi:TPA: DUF262 domain-containing protein [Pseudomonas aeruginosa]|nr:MULTISPECIES: DUF262 domain-containing protein [Pseudomonas]